MKRINKFTIGADPEFVFVDRHSKVGVYNPTRFYTTNSEVGVDCGDLIEIRPKYQNTAYELVLRVRKILLEMPLCNDKTREFDWIAGGIARVNMPTPRYHSDAAGRIRTSFCPYTATLGGHIHYGEQGNWWNEKYLPALTKLNSTLEHLDILPKRECVSRRRHGYGTLSDRIRLGEEPTIEYRQMPSWLFHPAVSFVCLGLTKLILADPEQQKKLKKLGEFKDLVSIVDSTKSADDDARILADVIFPLGLRRLQFDPKVDFLKRWKRWTPSIEGLGATGATTT